MFVRVIKLCLFLTLGFLVIFGARQTLMSMSVVGGQSDLASKLVYDFLSSPWAILDIVRFLFSLILIHLIFAVLVALAASAVVFEMMKWQTVRIVVILVFVLATLTVLVWISLYFPLTLAGFLKYSFLSSLNVAIGLSLFFGLLVIFGIARVVAQKQCLIVFGGSLCVIVLALSAISYYISERVLLKTKSMVVSSEKPNLVIIGVDALRPDHLGFNGHPSKLTPNIDMFLEDSLYFDEAFTPIARTYTAWFSLLSGRPPKSTGVRYNLQKFEASQLLGDELQNILKIDGYHTLYGMDERRFNNIDERYGFDEDVGPDIGAADFLLFHAGELPLVALVSNTPLGKWLFPTIYSNRGVYSTYMPETFTREVIGAVSKRPQKPLFLALHLTLPHWPFLYREFNPIDNIPFDPDQRFHYAYQLMLKEADKQFSDIISGLERQGVLDNALVFLISDHGEGFMLEQDALTSGNTDLGFPTAAHGHGTNVLDEKQYNVVLAIQDRRDSAPEKSYAGRNSTVVSLLDVAPTIASELGLDSALVGYEGQSLFDLHDCETCSDRLAFIESSVATNAMFEKDLDMVQVMAEGLGYYTISADGLAVVRDDVKSLLGLKQRAVINKNHIVAHFPGLEEDFLIVDRRTQIWWPSSRYGGGSANEVLSLMIELCSYFREDESFDKNQLCQGAVR